MTLENPRIRIEFKDYPPRPIHIFVDGKRVGIFDEVSAFWFIKGFNLGMRTALF